MKRIRELQQTMHGFYIVPLTQGYEALIDSEDAERVGQYNWSAVHGRKDGSREKVYAKAWIDGGRIVQLHRFILRITDPKIFVDHENHDGLDCRKLNMRPATNSQNNMNRRKRVGCSTDFKGVYLHTHTGKYAAQITINRENRPLGHFADPIEAAKAYDAAAYALFGEFANLNFKQVSK